MVFTNDERFFLTIVPTAAGDLGMDTLRGHGGAGRIAPPSSTCTGARIN